MACWTATTETGSTYEFDDEQNKVTRHTADDTAEVFTVLSRSSPAVGERLTFTAIDAMGTGPRRVRTTAVVTLQGAVPALV